MLKHIILVFFSLLLLSGLRGQVVEEPDTTGSEPVGLIIDPQAEKEVIPDSMAYLHSPKKAIIMSAILPGLGQIYNRKYWKVPILYAGFAVTAYYLQDNLKNISLYKEAYLAATDRNPETVNDTGYNNSQLLDIVEQYKNWRDLSYITFGAIYVLNLIDANVDAHLFYFDVSEDISMNIQPYFNFTAQRTAGFSLCLKL